MPAIASLEDLKGCPERSSGSEGLERVEGGI
jgi:hypothetical protein